LELSEARDGYVRWLTTARDLSPHTIRAYRTDLASFERAAGGDLCVDRIDGEILMDFLEGQKGRRLASASLRRRASALRGFCRWLDSGELVRADPWREVNVTLGGPRRLPRAMPTAELTRLLSFLSKAAGIDPDGAIHPSAMEERTNESTTLLAVALMVATGVRVQEVATLQCSDIDLDGRAIRLLGKGRRERQVFLTNEWITGLTAAYLETRATLAVGHPHLLFNLRFDPLSPAAIRSRLSKAATASGLKMHVTPHMLRHTAATQLIESGVDIRYIQRLLGHASLSTTEIYTHVSDTSLRRVVSDADVLGRLSRSR
jgi:site-specific recombinase XerD